jgi:DNA (cytosine-5)-methyltransferase 1
MLVGTDCSGIETPLMALRNLNLPVRHVFSCDNDPNVKKVILANFKPEVFFDDISQRKFHTDKCLEQQLDLYVAGFPCQPFSAAGVHGGTSDPRGLIIVHIIRFIQKNNPKTFLLENVKGLVSKKHRETFLTIMRRRSHITRFV